MTPLSATPLKPSTSSDKARLALPVAWAAVILWLSLVPSPPQFSGVLGWDKLQHAAAYGLLMLLVAQYLTISYGLRAQTALSSALLSILYGGVIEVLQHIMQAGRSAEWLDLLADAAGALAGCGLYLCLIISGRRRIESNQAG